MQVMIAAQSELFAGKCEIAIAKPHVRRSVSDDQTEILRSIIALHCPNGFDCDMSYGNGAFYKNIAGPRLKFDISPQVEGVKIGDSRNLPLEPKSIQSLVFDPPFLTYIKNGRSHKGGKVAMSARFGGYYTYGELEDHYRDSISEAYRVLGKKGKLVFKCQDIIHNHRMHCTHVRVIQMAELEGFRLADLFVLVANHRMPGPQKGKQRHARIFHSYFLVFEKAA